MHCTENIHGIYDPIHTECMHVNKSVQRTNHDLLDLCNCKSRKIIYFCNSVDNEVGE